MPGSANTFSRHPIMLFLFNYFFATVEDEPYYAIYLIKGKARAKTCINWFLRNCCGWRKNMTEIATNNDACGCGGPAMVGLPPLPMFQPGPDKAPCCGAPAGPPASVDERPGYRLCSFVERFVETPVGQTPQVKAGLGMEDWLGSIRARLGISRNRYRIAPGLYSVGAACADSAVLVTANNKLSFDALRRELAGVDAWILVLDTRGVNVWCAAGKKTFGTEEVIRQVQRTRLLEIVNHRQLIFPQLGAPGVAAHRVRKACGFAVIWGPIRARDLREFLAAGRQATPVMRQLTFTMAERMVLIPVEISLIVKPSLWILPVLFVLAAISPHFSLALAWQRGRDLTMAFGAGVFSGAVLTPILLPWLPWRSFYLKGLLIGLIGGLAVVAGRGGADWDALAMVLFCMAVSSYAAMNFTGATPYASPSGVEKEMRRGIPVQVAALLASGVLWVGGQFWF